MANLHLNKVILCGRVITNPELKITPTTIPVCSFRLAVNRKYQKEGEQTADFFNCVAWRQRAEFISRYFHKGSSFCIEGEIQTRKYVDHTGGTRYITEIVVADAYFVDSKGEGGAAPAEDYPPASGEFVPVDDEQLPF